MFRIMSSRYKDEVIEEIDTFDTEGEAQVTLVEYQLAFGHDFALWIESVKGKLEKEFDRHKDSAIPFEEFLATHHSRIPRWGGNPGTLTHEALTKFGPPGSEHLICNEALYYFRCEIAAKKKAQVAVEAVEAVEAATETLAEAAADIAVCSAGRV